MKCKDCRYYEPCYGVPTSTGWTRDGSSGYCCVEPKKETIDGERITCRHFVSKKESEGMK
jgi:hypothetical protein